MAAAALSAVVVSVVLYEHLLLVNGFPGGAPAQACSTLTPSAVAHLSNSQASETLPYTLNLSSLLLSEGGYGYKPGQQYQLSVHSSSTPSQPLRGILLQGRQAADDTTPMGSWDVVDADNTKLSSCDPSTSAITHSNSDDKQVVYVSWTAPGAGSGSLKFGWAVVQVRDTYWADLRSPVIVEVHSGTHGIKIGHGIISGMVLMTLLGVMKPHP